MANNPEEGNEVDEQEMALQTRLLVIKALIWYSLIALGSISYLAATDSDIPESLIATLSMAVGALGGLAAK